MLVACIQLVKIEHEDEDDELADEVKDKVN